MLVTGASGGIGRAVALRFARAGYAVAVHYYQGERAARALVAQLTEEGHTAIAVQADVRDGAQVRRMVDNVLDKFCQLDILICNAGLAWQGLFGDMTEEEWHNLFAVNVDGAFHCVQAVLPGFIAAKGGKIVTVSSMWGQVGASCEVAYSATKAAIIGLTKALAKELGPSGITANCVAPGMIDTEMNRHLDPEALEMLREEIPLGRIGGPADVAESVLFLASPAGDFLTGQVISPNGGMVV